MSFSMPEHMLLDSASLTYRGLCNQILHIKARSSLSGESISRAKSMLV